MDVYGMDFTSSPGRRKPITRQHCRLEDDVLRAQASAGLTSFRQFEEALALPGPWIAGIDLPFGQARRFIVEMGWPPNWEGYVLHAESLGKEKFEAALRRYSDGQPQGRKAAPPQDRQAGACSEPAEAGLHAGRKNVLRGRPAHLALRCDGSTTA